MDLADKSNDLHELVEARANHLHFVVRHLEDALVMRHRRKRFLISTSHGTRSRFHDAVNTPTSTSPTLVGDSPPISASVKGIPWYHVLPLTKSNRTRIPGPRPCSPQSSSYLVGLYLIIKALYVFNSTGQIFLTARYLGHNSLFYGVYLLIDQLSGREWDGTGNFPRVTYCDFDMRRMGSNMHRHTLQCVLPINMFNEKIFMLLWFWLAAVTCCNVNSFLGWCNRSAFQSNRLAFIKGLLIQHTNHFKAATSSPPPPPAQQNVRNSSTLTTTTTTSTPTPVTPQFTTPDEKQCVKNFTEHVLGQDGVFVLRLVSINAGRRVAIDILHQLWTRYLRVIGLSSGSRQQPQRPTGLSIPGVTNSNNNGQPPIPKRSNLIGQLGRGLISSQFPTSAATAAVTLRRRRGVGRRDRDEEEDEERRRRSHRRQSESSQAFSSISPPPALTHQGLLLDEDHELGSWAGGSVVESDGRETLLNDGLI